MLSSFISLWCIHRLFKVGLVENSCSNVSKVAVSVTLTAKDATDSFISWLLCMMVVGRR